MNLDNGAHLLRDLWEVEYKRKKNRYEVDATFIVTALALIRDVADVESAPSHRAIFNSRLAEEFDPQQDARYRPVYFSAEISSAEAARTLLRNRGKRIGCSNAIAAADERCWNRIVQMSEDLASDRAINWTAAARQVGISRQSLQEQVEVRSMRTMAALRRDFPSIFDGTARRPRIQRTGVIWGAGADIKKKAA